MLVNKLNEFYGYKWRYEISINRRKRSRELGVRDILGYYDVSRKKIFICEEELTKCSASIAKSVGVEKYIVWHVLRELVRLHE